MPWGRSPSMNPSLKSLPVTSWGSKTLCDTLAQVNAPRERGVRSEEAEAADVGELKARRQQEAAAAARAQREDPQEQERKRAARQQREAAKTEEAAKLARLALMREKLAPTPAGDTSTGRDGRPVPEQRCSSDWT